MLYICIKQMSNVKTELANALNAWRGCAQTNSAKDDKLISAIVGLVDNQIAAKVKLPPACCHSSDSNESSDSDVVMMASFRYLPQVLDGTKESEWPAIYTINGTNASKVSMENIVSAFNNKCLNIALTGKNNIKTVSNVKYVKIQNHQPTLTWTDNVYKSDSYYIKWDANWMTLSNDATLWNKTIDVLPVSDILPIDVSSITMTHEPLKTRVKINVKFSKFVKYTKQGRAANTELESLSGQPYLILTNKDGDEFNAVSYDITKSTSGGHDLVPTNTGMFFYMPYDDISQLVGLSLTVNSLFSGVTNNLITDNDTTSPAKLNPIISQSVLNSVRKISF